jgi:hypothetical protein
MLQGKRKMKGNSAYALMVVLVVLVQFLTVAKTSSNVERS